MYAGHASEFLEFFASVPQGSILAPLLFLIYLYDIEDNIKSDISLFADDVTLLKTFKNHAELENLLNEDLKTLDTWAKTWKMEFNPNKSEMIIFSNKKTISKPSIILRSTKINQVHSHKHLGLYFAQDMSCSIHIDNCIKKTNKKLGLLRRQSYVLKKIQRIDIYKTMIKPIIEYGAVLTDNCSISDALKLDKVQRTAALICTGARVVVGFSWLGEVRR